MEVEHTADWALQVWAPDLSELFAQSAMGMYWLMETTLQTGSHIERSIVLEGGDTETLLVSFLAELLYFGESDGIGFDDLRVSVEPERLSATMRGAAILDQKKEIKAVTYHNLAVRQTGQGFAVTIVFDV